MKKARQKRANNIQFYFDEVPKINKSTETENIMVTKSGGGGHRRWVFNADRVSN